MNQDGVVVIEEDPHGDRGSGADGGRHAYDTRAIPLSTISRQVPGEPQSRTGSAVQRSFSRWGIPVDEVTPPSDLDEPSPFPGLAAGFTHLRVIKNPPPSMAAVWADYWDGHREVSANFGPLAVLPYHLFGMIGLPIAILCLIGYDANIRPARTGGFLLVIALTFAGLVVAGVI